MHANHQESTSIKICDLLVKRVCRNSITKGHLKREGLFLFLKYEREAYVIIGAHQTCEYLKRLRPPTVY
jgi:hypothetical protein